MPAESPESVSGESGELVIARFPDWGPNVTPKFASVVVVESVCVGSLEPVFTESLELISTGSAKPVPAV